MKKTFFLKKLIIKLLDKIDKKVNSKKIDYINETDL